MQKIVTYLWFDNRAEEAVDFYISLFKDAKMGKVMRYNADSSKVSGQPEGSVMTVAFELFGQDFVALNGGPVFQFTPAISFLVNCETQEEIDRLWDQLSDGGEIMECGWVNDKYGVSWQIVPTLLDEWLSHPDPAKAERAMQAMLTMKKLDIATLKQAIE